MAKKPLKFELRVGPEKQDPDEKAEMKRRARFGGGPKATRFPDEVNSKNISKQIARARAKRAAEEEDAAPPVKMSAKDSAEIDHIKQMGDSLEKALSAAARKKK